MEERNHTSAPETAKKCCCCGWGAFLVGLVVALILGWAVLPALMQKELKQPVAFNHVLHVDEQGMDCRQCHFAGPDGQFSGVPTTASCAECHSEAIGNTPEEIRFVQDYVQTGREIRSEWLIYLKQPDNVFFSHSVHSVERCSTCHTEYAENPGALCKVCHIDMSKVTTPPVYSENRLSGYPKGTMLMWDCERCHTNPNHLSPATNANNACFVCHK